MRTNNLSGQLIPINYISPQFFEKVGYRALARAHTACQTNNNHLSPFFSPAILSAVCNVLGKVSGIMLTMTLARIVLPR